MSNSILIPMLTITLVIIFLIVFIFTLSWVVQKLDTNYTMWEDEVDRWEILEETEREEQE